MKFFTILLKLSGFTIASNNSLANKKHQKLPENLKYLNEIEYKNAFIFPKDIQTVETKINTIDNPVILNYFLEEWNKWKSDMSNSF